jgi:hypothetical protein
LENNWLNFHIFKFINGALVVQFLFLTKRQQLTLEKRINNSSFAKMYVV